jgi:hypothetical protein
VQELPTEQKRKKLIQNFGNLLLFIIDVKSEPPLARSEAAFLPLGKSDLYNFMFCLPT